MKMRLLLVALLILFAGALVFGEQGPSSAPVPKPPSAEVRLANVRKAMAENSIDFRATVSLGDDGRVVVRVTAVDMLQ